jgi:hypothetical protein
MSGLFKTLQNVTTKKAEALARILLGDTVAAKNGLLAFGFRDSAGNATLPQLTSDGRLAVTGAIPGIEKHSGPGSLLLTALNAFQEVTITYPATVIGKIYSLEFISASSCADVIWEVRHFNGTTEVVIFNFVTGAGCYNYAEAVSCPEITAVTVADEVRVYAKQLDGELETVFASYNLLEKA